MSGARLFELAQAREVYNDGGMDEDGDGERESPAFGATLATKDACCDYLRTSLALVKGELGTRASDAPYATIHGGLQGAFTALATFEERLDSKASSVRVDGLVTGTNACYDRAQRLAEPSSSLSRLEVSPRSWLWSTNCAT